MPGDVTWARGPAHSFRTVHPIVLKLASYRQALNMSQQEIADRIPVHRRSVNNWECGRSDPLLRDVAAYAEAVGARLILEVPDDAAREAG
jgi:transcriptional regulator with XRE-family HTH domain